MTTKKLLRGCVLGSAVLISSCSFAMPGAHQHGHAEMDQAYQQHEHMRNEYIAPTHHHPMRHRYHNHRSPFYLWGRWFR